ncbi:hypothetical protein AHAS_Ahas14G0016800 [Arachis hypogaea]
MSTLQEFPRNSPDIEGWTRDQSQIPDTAGVDAGKLRELDARVSGLELEAKNCNANSGSSGVSVKALVIAFVISQNLLQPWSQQKEHFVEREH